LTLWTAGVTLEEVFKGMKDWKFKKSVTEGGWNYVYDHMDLGGEAQQYFPDYKPNPVTHGWMLEKLIPEPPETLQVD
jgi:hypothetical protein